MSYGTAFFDLPVSPEDVYARAKTAEWLLRLMPRTRFLNEEFFACVQWIAGGLQRPVQEMEKKGAQIRRVPGIVLARKDLQMLLKSREERLPGGLETLFEEHPCLRKLLFEMVKHECLAVMGRSSGMGAYGTARTRLAQTFGMNTGSLALCEFLFINQNFSVAEAYFKDSANIGSYENRQLFAEMLDMTPGDLRTCLEELFRCGLIENNYSILRLNESLLPFWDENCTNIEELFARPVNGEALPLEAFQIAREDVEHIRNLLEHEGREPVHILLYGPPGTGKTSFVHSLVRFCGIRAWAVRGRLEDDDKDRQLSLSACLHLASHHRGALVIVDEAEHLLDTGMYLGIRTSNKAGLNALLEEPSRRIVWIVNRVDGIDPAVRRRFSFSVHFNGLGAKERETVWRQILDAQNTMKSIDEADIRFLSRMYPVEADVIQNAVTQAARLHSEQSTFLAVLQRILVAQMTLQNNGERPRIRIGENTEFMPEGVCLEGDCREVLEHCHRIDTAMRAGVPMRPGIGTMLFYGPPGTGKTALARYIADCLGRECMTRRASDLLSPYVGVSERKIADTFAQAARDGAVLVVDEVDTFLFARNGELRSWENSLVNEFLTSLEEYRGFCICTTNRQLDLDAAVIRRFSHKIAFSHARREQILKLYACLLAPLCTVPMTEAERAHLLGLNGLVPGDFHTVRCQYDPLVMNMAEVSHNRLIEALASELRLKTKRQVRPVGFGR